MSQPKRYVATYDDGFVTNEYREECKSDKLDCNNIWVKAEDYAVLAAENERLNYKLGRLLMAEKEWELVEPGEYARIKSEVERLRKAGDAMRDCVDSDTFPNIIAAWNAAKEGASK